MKCICGDFEHICGDSVCYCREFVEGFFFNLWKFLCICGSFCVFVEVFSEFVGVCRGFVCHCEDFESPCGDFVCFCGRFVYLWRFFVNL